MPAFMIQVAAASYAALFAAAALGKATAWADWSALAGEVAGKRAALVRLPVPVGEGVLAVVLVVFPVAGLTAAASALAVFAVAVLSVRGRLAGRSCGCFGRFSQGRFSGRLAARNAVLAAGAAVFAVGAGRAGSHPVPWWSCVAVLSGWAVFAGMRAFPSLLAGLRTTPEPFLAAGLPVLLVFVRQQCDPCRSLLPYVAAWQRDLTGVVSVVALDADGGPAAKEPGWPDLLPGRRAAEHYRVHATPAAVALGADGVVSARAEGDAAIVSLAARLAGEAEAALPSPELFSRRRLVGDGARVFAGVLSLPVLLRHPRPHRAAAMCDPCARVKCSCNGKFYDDPQVCLAECRVSLGCFTGICGPVPSDKFHCGSNCCEPGQKCVNGACVDSCPPQYVPCGCTCCPPGQTCEGNRCMPKKMCGPDISDALGDALARTRAEFGRWSSSKRDDACSNLVSVLWGTAAWDITQLSPSGRKKFTDAYGPECSSCGYSVQVGSDCHFDGSVNYVLFGSMMRLCHDHYKAEDRNWKASWHDEDAVIDLIALHKSYTGVPAANLRASASWGSAGYNGWPGDALSPDGDRQNCETGCPKKYSGPGLTVQWYPNVIRP